ncbi:MAG TPA: hypothetical protein VES20_07075 [Bryobacteraceae bacterium]|nr:hypothetical protein [Bryobacteraceae bacterium]
MEAQPGSKPRRLTYHPGIDMLPTWSTMGDMVHFTSNRSGTFRVWRIPAAGGETEPVTDQAASSPAFSPDGRFIYFSKGKTIWRMPATGGASQQVAVALEGRSFTPTRDGVVYLGPQRRSTIELRSWNALLKKDSLVATLEGYFDEGLSVSPDGRSVLLHRYEHRGSDLMMVEGMHSAASAPCGQARTSSAIHSARSSLWPTRKIARGISCTCNCIQHFAGRLAAA